LNCGGAIPATDVMVADYVAAHAETLAVATLDEFILDVIDRFDERFK
jgi:hypothetical protein